MGGFTSALESVVRLLLSFNDLLQHLFLLVALQQLPRDTVVLDFQLAVVRPFGLFKGLLCVSIEEERALSGIDNRWRPDDMDVAAGGVSGGEVSSPLWLLL